MRAREAAAAHGRDAAAAASAIHAENLQELQTLRTPEELAADAAADLHDMITGASASQQAARASQDQSLERKRAAAARSRRESGKTSKAARFCSRADAKAAQQRSLS